MPKKLRKYLLNKYSLTLIAFFFYLLFVSSNDLFTQYNNAQTLHELEMEKDELLHSIETNRAKLEELSTNMESIEKFGRETYLMKKADEVIYVITPEKD